MKRHPEQQEEEMTTVSIQEAQANLSELIHRLAPEGEVVITEGDQAVARLLPATGKPQRPPRRPGTLRGTVLYMAPDFDAPLEDFKEYME
jgi:antitoxin (DNA-binding transcriptional repressor) of toxin-antitoxin stability system